MLWESVEPDGIILAHETYTLVRNHVDAEELDPISVKGISRKVRPYAIRGTFEDSATSERYIRDEQEGFRLWIDVKRMTASEKANTAGALEAAARKLKAP